MSAESAGILPFRERKGALEVLIAHPGGPFWAKRHHGAWSIVKGEVTDGEHPFSAAQREFAEETGFSLDPEWWVELGTVRQKAGKIIHGWGCPADLDESALISNTFTTEWPPRSGQVAEFPEIDRVVWCAPHEAFELLNPAQGTFVERLLAAVRAKADKGGSEEG